MHFSTNNANEHRCLQQFLSCLLQNSKLNSYLVNIFILCLSVLRILLDTSVNFLFYFSGLFYCCWWCCCCFRCCFGRLFLSLCLSLFFSFRIYNLYCLIELIIFHLVSFVPATETTTTTPPPNSNRSKPLAKECHYDHYLINEWPKSNIARKLIQMIEIFKLQTHHNHHNVFLIPHKI